MVPIVRHVFVACVVVTAGTLLLPRKDPSFRGRRIAMAPVVVALEEIAEGRAIDRASVGVGVWPVSNIPAGAYSSVHSVIGRVSRINVFRGEPIVPGRLAPGGTAAGLEVKLTPGERAYSIRI